MRKNAFRTEELQSGATPLFALKAVALDCETTGLDVEKDRIVQLGGLAIDNGRLNTAAVFDQIVDPQMAIPEKSIRVHGITNPMAREAPVLADIWSDFSRFYLGRVVIGHTIGFDLTMLEREAARCGLDWQRPRSLCVRLLASLALPSLPGYSLEALSEWFEIEIRDRHSALGDARAAGEIFIRLVPLLEKKGLRTLAETERASLASSPQLSQQQQSGWVSPVADPQSAALTGGVRLHDTHAYRHTVGEVMAQPVIVVPSHMQLAEAMRIMAEKQISSVLIADPPEPLRKPADYAILTERDVLRRIAAEGAAALTRPIDKEAARPLQTIREGAFLYRAIGRMGRLKIRHLPVVNETGHVSGMISARDLLKLRTDPAIALNDEIDTAGEAAEMAAAWAKLPAVTRSLIDEQLEAPIICRIVSEEIRAMTRRAAKLAEQAMAAEGLGAAPFPYAVLVLGSGGRGESLLKPDQDNAIIFEANDATSEALAAADRWFAELGQRLATILDQAGIPLCDGGVMARNAEWRGSLGEWQTRITDWVTHAKPENLLNVDIFYDQIAVYGERRLASELFDFSYTLASGNPVFAKALGEKLDATGSPFTFTGQFRQQAGRLDLKKFGLFPIVAGARTLAIRHNLQVHSTRERLAALAALDRGDTALIKDLSDSHALILERMLESQQHEIAIGRKPTNGVDITRLSREAKTELKRALKRVQLIPELVRDLMF